MSKVKTFLIEFLTCGGLSLILGAIPWSILNFMSVQLTSTKIVSYPQACLLVFVFFSLYSGACRGK